MLGPASEPKTASRRVLRLTGSERLAFFSRLCEVGLRPGQQARARERPEGRPDAHSRLGTDLADQLVVVGLDVRHVVLVVETCRVPASASATTLRAQDRGRCRTIFEGGLAAREDRLRARLEETSRLVGWRLGEALVLPELEERREDPDRPQRHARLRQLRVASGEGDGERGRTAWPCRRSAARARRRPRRGRAASGQSRRRRSCPGPASCAIGRGLAGVSLGSGKDVCVRDARTHVWSSPPRADEALDHVASQLRRGPKHTRQRSLRLCKGGTSDTHSETTKPWKPSSVLSSVLSKGECSHACVPFSELRGYREANRQ